MTENTKAETPSFIGVGVTHIGAHVPSVSDRYNAARRKLQRQHRKFTGIVIVTSHTVGSEEKLPAHSRMISQVIKEMEPQWYLWDVFTNYNDGITFKEKRLQ